MVRCRSCGTENQPAARFCSGCGARWPAGDSGRSPSADAATLDTDEIPTLGPMPPVAPSPRPPRSASKSGLTGSSTAIPDSGRFLPGSLLAERYRVVALLGRGGMGEVYRADDLTLGQPVALKFLPEEAAGDVGLLERFRAEVRISRKVSHPNVCRVYDVGEVDRQTYFTMEYVDGEDLASLLRRIGRLPDDKALDIARQLCAGLAAAHARGVLHRDLKPANIMLDGRGQAVITDFGLAALTGQAEGAEVRSGTPAYMAPEQLAGREVTEKSDLYSLGLVLYEIFTGKRAFSAENLTELVRSRAAGVISRPSSFVKDLDPLVERVILRCLEVEPANRPGSALAVAAALPGGDPLAAALAAGETPSPQMVAAAGTIEGMNPRQAMPCIAACVLGVIAAVALIVSNDGLARVPLELSPEVLEHRCRDIIHQLGFDDRGVDSATDFVWDGEFQRWVESNDKPRPDWNRVLTEQPSMLAFRFRQSPRYMLPLDLQISLTPGVVTFNDPPATISGMTNMVVDPVGRLTFFQRMPPQVDESLPASGPMNWNPLLEAAGLSPAQLQAATPKWNSLAASDTRAAWTGQWPGGSGRPLHIEAAAWRGQPVYFQMSGPWTQPSRMRSPEPTRARKIGQVIGFILSLALIACASALAWHHYRRGKGDTQGASRLGRWIFLAQMAIFLCYGHFVPDLNLLQPVALAVSTALLVAGFVWVLYMALEPFVRKLWPQSIISWTRLMSGRIRDPLVGRDVMFGVMLGLTWVILSEALLNFGIRHFGTVPQLASTNYLAGFRSTLGMWLVQMPNGIQGTLLFFFVLVSLGRLLRNRWAAGAAFVALFTVTQTLGSRHPAIDIPIYLMIYGIAAFAQVRFGLVTLAVAVFVANMMLNLPVTLSFSRWYAVGTVIVPLGILALGVWGFWTALAGQKLFKGEMLE